MTIAQAPPKSYFGTSSGSVINNGKTTYYCSISSSSGNSGNSGSSGNSGNCGNSGNSGNASSTTTTTSKRYGDVHLGEGFQLGPRGSRTSSARPSRSARCREAENSLPRRTRSGSRCPLPRRRSPASPRPASRVTVRGKTGKYCVTKQGLLSYSGSSKSSYFELTKYSSKPPASLFTLPAGATTADAPRRRVDPVGRARQ